MSFRDECKISKKNFLVVEHFTKPYLLYKILIKRFQNDFLSKILLALGFCNPAFP